MEIWCCASNGTISWNPVEPIDFVEENIWRIFVTPRIIYCTSTRTGTVPVYRAALDRLPSRVWRSWYRLQLWYCAGIMYYYLVRRDHRSLSTLLPVVRTVRFFLNEIEAFFVGSRLDSIRSGPRRPHFIATTDSSLSECIFANIITYSDIIAAKTKISKHDGFASN
jgi:hypothetical protein